MRNHRSVRSCRPGAATTTPNRSGGRGPVGMSVSRALTAHPRPAPLGTMPGLRLGRPGTLPKNDLIGLSTLDAVYLKSAISAKDVTVRRRSCGDHVEIVCSGTSQGRTAVAGGYMNCQLKPHDCRPGSNRAPLRGKTVLRKIVLCLLNRLTIGCCSCPEAAPGGGRRERRRATAAEALVHTKWVMTLSAWSGEARTKRA
jgi:hypothetical protein